LLKRTIVALGALELLLAVSLASCGDEDRIVTITCAPREGPVISANFNGTFPRGMTAEIFDPKVYALGTILSISKSPDTDSDLVKGPLYQLKVPINKQYSLQKTWIQGQVLHAAFTIHADSDVTHGVELSGADLYNVIVQDTRLYATAVHAVAINDIQSQINNDPGAVALIRKHNRDSQLAVVTATGSSENISILYNTPVGYTNLLRVGDYYIHLTYSCSPYVSTHSSQDISGSGKPIIYFYTPVYYDSVTMTVKTFQ
jgi:hypothetical protein